MKSIKLYLLLFFMTIVSISHGQVVNFVDVNFKDALIANPSINISGDGEIQELEAQIYTGSIYLTGVSNLTGLEYFTELTGFSCDSCMLDSFDLASCTKLESVTIRNSLWDTVYFPNNPLLTSIDCRGVLINHVDVSNKEFLESISIWETSISNIDLSNNPLLETLTIRDNSITSLDVSNNSILDKLIITNNNIGSLDLSENDVLDILYCSGNLLTELYVPASVTDMECMNNNLTELDLSANIGLIGLYCDSNNLQSLNIRNGNNVNIDAAKYYFKTFGNPNLSCIEVDDAPMAGLIWSNYVDTWTAFSNDCLVNIEEKPTVISQPIAYYDLTGKLLGDKTHKPVRNQFYIVRTSDGRTSKRIFN